MRKRLLPLILALAGCGGVTPIARSERAAVGWGFFSLNYCMEPGVPASADEEGFVVGYPAAAAGLPAYGVGERESDTRQREIAEIMLFSRESLYRVCEALRNGDVDENQAVIMRQSIVQLTEKLITMRNQHEASSAGRAAARDRQRTLDLVASLTADIAGLEARAKKECAPGDAACSTAFRERVATREALLGGLQSALARPTPAPTP